MIDMYLLDTNVVSETRRPRPHGAVLAWFQSVAADTLHISAVTLGEIQAGVEITREQDPEKAKQLDRWADLIANQYTQLPMTGAAYRKWAVLMHRQSNTLRNDGMIAATALVHGLTVVTRNVSDFRRFGVTLVNPFETQLSS
jgi:toxin FitB